MAVQLLEYLAYPFASKLNHSNYLFNLLIFIQFNSFYQFNSMMTIFLAQLNAKDVNIHINPSRQKTFTRCMKGVY